MNFPKIGMRNIKTSTSVFLCLLLFQAINRENSLHACIAAVICVQNTVENSFAKGISRIVGTVIGGIAGALVLYIIDTFSHEGILIYIIPLGMVILIQICVSIHEKQSVVICCVVYLGLLIGDPKGGYVLYTLNRVIDTSIGIIVAILVNRHMKIPERLKESIGKEDATEWEDVLNDEIAGENKQDRMNIKEN